MPTPEIFRREALDHFAASQGRVGGVLRIRPAWVRRSYRLMILTSLCVLGFLCFGSVNEYAVGPAVVRAVGQIDVASRTAGTVSSVEVAPGQRVREGEVLVRLSAAAEMGELAQATQDFEAQLQKTLRDPGDRPAREALASVAARRELAGRRLDERVIRAPSAGIVGDLRVRPEQYLAPGETAVTLRWEQSRFEVLAALPGRYRPAIRAGALFRLEISGFPNAYQALALESADGQVVGPHEVRRALGPGLADSVVLDGPVFLVRARLPVGGFSVDGETYQFHDGLPGTARVRAHRLPILLMLVPWLRGLTHHGP